MRKHASMTMAGMLGILLAGTVMQSPASALTTTHDSPAASNGRQARTAPGDGIRLNKGDIVSLQVTTAGFTDRFLSLDGAGLAVTSKVDKNSAEAARKSASFTIEAGLDGNTCYSFESIASPGQYLRHQGGRLKASTIDSDLGNKDATFCAQSGLGGSGVSLVSRNYPTNYIRHRNAQVWVDKNTSPAPFKTDASWTVATGLSAATTNPGGPTLPTSDTPDFGPNVKIYDQSVPASKIQSDIDAAFTPQIRSATAQFGEQRDTFLFKPGNYGRIFANLGYYTTIAGLGKNPDDVNINGALNVDAGWNLGDEGNATQNFWRSVENISVTPEEGFNRFAVSQAAPVRRLHVKGDLVLNPSNQDINTQQGYASGGYLADSKVDGKIISGSQQQWYTRDSTIGGWDGGVWNMVYSGVKGAPSQSFPKPPYTTLATTPVSREKPYLYVDNAGKYNVFVPKLSRNSSGATWPNTPGDAIPMSKFYVAKPSDSAAKINQALDQGLNLFFTPGVYRMNETLKINKANTVVMGLGFPTIIPENGVNGMSVADVDGVKVSGILFDAGTKNSPELLTVGQKGASADHSANPTSIQDVFFRIGGAVAGKSTTSLVVNSDDVMIDHIWAWRGDHGKGIGWNLNTADTGVIVNGDDVLATGLFVEHYQKYEVIWNGENGKTIFFQNELPYDVPNQASWTSGNGQGWAAYKVADNVNNHELWGGGSYVFFEDNPSIVASRAFEVPNKAGVKLHDILTVSLGDVGTIANVVNNTGGPVPIPGANSNPRNVINFGG